MPETTMHEDDFSSLSENDVRFPREVLSVETVAVAQGMEHAADTEFRLSVLAANAAHPFAAFCGGERVHVIAIAAKRVKTILS